MRLHIIASVHFCCIGWQTQHQQCSSHHSRKETGHPRVGDSLVFIKGRYAGGIVSLTKTSVKTVRPLGEVWKALQHKPTPVVFTLWTSYAVSIKSTVHPSPHIPAATTSQCQLAPVFVYCRATLTTLQTSSRECQAAGQANPNTAMPAGSLYLSSSVPS